MTEKLLFVDDEPNILSGLRRQLRGVFEIGTANNGQEALDIIAASEPFAVIVSDFRMPGMDGIQFLAHAKAVSPESVRILLTGHADLGTAIEAVNNGAIFRFLTKPCPPAVLTDALQAGVEQFRLVTAERDLLEKTLSKTVNLLTDILSLANPAAFGRAVRARRIVGEICANLKLPNAWQYNLAAMLSQIGCVALPPALLEKISAGAPLNKDEEKLFASHPLIGYKLLESIPRLDQIAEMVKDQDRPFAAYTAGGGSKRQVNERGAQILKVALDYDQVVQNGTPHVEAVRWMQAQDGLYNPEMIAALGQKKIASDTWVMKVVNTGAVEVGMILGDEVHTADGKLLLAKGLDVTPAMLEHLNLMAQNVGVVEPLRVLIRTPENTGIF